MMLSKYFTMMQIKFHLLVDFPNSGGGEGSGEIHQSVSLTWAGAERGWSGELPVRTDQEVYIDTVNYLTHNPRMAIGLTLVSN